MYDITDKAQAIKEVQKYLLELSYAEEYLPRIAVDGIYGAETKEAVEMFQKRYGITPNGVVDYLTWQLLYGKYILAKEEREMQSDLIPAEAFPLQLGDSGSHVHILQSTLWEILEETGVRDGFFGRSTDDAVRRVEKRYGIPGTGIVSRSLWNRMTDDYRHRIRQKMPE